jgi:hypothetical protein
MILPNFKDLIKPPWKSRKKSALDSPVRFLR